MAAAQVGRSAHSQPQFDLATTTNNLLSCLSRQGVEVLEQRFLLSAATTFSATAVFERAQSIATRTQVVDVAFSKPVPTAAKSTANYILKTAAGETVTPSSSKLSADGKTLALSFKANTAVSGAKIVVKSAVRSSTGQSLTSTSVPVKVVALTSGAVMPAITPNAVGTTFGGTLAVIRVTDTQTTTSRAAPVFLDKYTIAANGGLTLAQSIALPTADAGTQHAITASGTATSDGDLSRSVDGHYLFVTGYDAAPGTSAVVSTAASTNPRVVARIDAGTNTVDTSTAISNTFDGNNLRSVASLDGSNLWLVGPPGNNNNGGIQYAAFGSNTATAMNAAANARSIRVFNGQLYVSADSTTSTFAVAKYGTGLPTSGSQSFTTLPGMPKAATPSSQTQDYYGFQFIDDKNLVLVDNNGFGSNGGIEHWQLNSSTGNWSMIHKFVGSPAGVTGYVRVAATVSPLNGHWEVFATSSFTGSTANQLLAYDYDPAALTDTLVGTPITAPAFSNFRGVQLFTDPLAVTLALDSASDTGASNADSITKDNRPTFAVTASRAGTITLDYNADGIADQTFVAPAGDTFPHTYSVTYPTALAAITDGIKTVSATLTTADNGFSVSGKQITVDTAGLKISSVTFDRSGSTTWKARVSFGGDLIDTSTATLADFMLTGPNGTITPSGFDGLDLSFPAQTAFGTYTLKIGPAINDIAGNAMDQNNNGTPGESPADQYVTSFLISLPATVSTDLQAADDSGATDSDNITKVTTPRFDVTVNQAGTIALDTTGDGVADVTASVTASGTYTLTSPALADGGRNVVATFTPTLGAAVQSDALAVTIDTLAPTLTAFFATASSSSILASAHFSEQLDSGTVVPFEDIKLFDSNGNAVVPGTGSLSGTTFNGTDYSINVQDAVTSGQYNVVAGNSNLADLAGNHSTATASQLVAVGSFLTVSVSKTSVNENAATPALTAFVTRQGSVSGAVTVTLGTTAAGLSVPASVVIADGQQSVSFNVNAVSDGLANGNRSVKITATATGYGSNASPTVTVVDTDVPALTLQLPLALKEGDAPTTGRVIRNTPTTADLIVQLTPGVTGQLNLPAAVTIPAGQSYVDFAISAIDDTTIEAAAAVQVTASAPGLTSGSASVTVSDGVPSVTGMQLTRSGGYQLLVSFSENVQPSLGAADVTLTQLFASSSQTVQLVLQGYNSATNTATLQFAGTGVLGNDTALAQGKYRLTINAAGVTDAAGNAIDGDNNGTPGGDYVSATFLNLYDPDGDGYVSNADRVRVTNNQGKANAVFADGDLNLDGVIDAKDISLAITSMTRYSTVSPVAPAWSYLYT